MMMLRGRILRRSSFVVLLVLAVWLASSIVSVSPLEAPHSGAAVAFPPDTREAIYAPFDSLLTDIADYIWPTNASTVVTSSFAEFRTTHFHGGIDISTNNRKGYEVYAARDGSIVRVQVSPYGYGKMLYLRHADGYYTTYAHLQRFNEGVETLVRERQYAAERYAVNITLEPGEYPVRKGDVIAYTGDTGVGEPHLHFELRDERLNPVNPFLLPAFAATVEDDIPPTFEAVAFSPLDFSSLVQGDDRPRSARVVETTRGEFSLKEVFHLTGNVGVSVRVFDRLNHTVHRKNIRLLSLYLDSLLLFTARLDRFPGEESKQIALHFDWSLLRAGLGRFQKLYVEPGNRLPLYERLPVRSGILASSLYGRGPRTVRIVAVDQKGNESTLTVRVVFNDPPVIRTHSVDGKVFVQRSETQTLNRIIVSTGKAGRDPRVQRFPVGSLPTGVGGIELPINLRSAPWWKVEAEDEFGTRSAPRFIVTLPAAASKRPSLELEKTFVRDYLSLTVTASSPFTSPPTVSALSGTNTYTTETRAREANSSVATIPLALVQNDSLRLVVQAEVSGVPVRREEVLSVVPITPARGGRVVSSDGFFAAHFPIDAVNDTLYCRIEKTDEGYALHPQDVVLNRGVTIRYALPPETGHRLGLYVTEGGGFRFATAEVGKDNALVTTVTRLLGSYVLRADTLAPRISNIRASYGRGRLSFSFHLSDRGSGIDADRIRITLNDELLIGEYDPYGQRVTFEEPRSLKAGDHVLRIVAYDRMGNRSSGQRTISVGGK